MRLEFWLPVKPLAITQAWGIRNPAYERFGFSRHNGTDIALLGKKELHWPIANCKIYDTEFGQGTGWRIKGRTLDQYLFPDGKYAYVDIIMMHMEAKSPIPVGAILNVGEYCGIPDSTGFSTGPHVHVMGRRVDEDGNLIDSNDADNSFDLIAYWNGYHAVDKSKVIGTLKELIAVLQKAITNYQTKKIA